MPFPQRRHSRVVRMLNVQCSMFNVPSTILINKVCFFFASLCVSASEGAAVVRPVPRGAVLGCGIPAFFPFPVFFSAFPGVILVRYACQSRSVFRKKYGFCDIFRGFPFRYGQEKSVFLAESPPNCRFSACFVICNAVVFSAYLGK